MSELRIRLQNDRRAFSPGETVSGTVSWTVDEPPAKAELNLLWSTRGKGTQDVENVATIDFPDPQSRDSRSFRMPLPTSPYSFSGQLISLVWTLELNLDPGDQHAADEIVVAPSGQEVLLPRISKTT
jgi:hypothetical protein